MLTPVWRKCAWTDMVAGWAAGTLAVMLGLRLSPASPSKQQEGGNGHFRMLSFPMGDTREARAEAV